MKKSVKITLTIIASGFVFLTVANLLTRSRLRTEITIQAPVENVWSVLMDHNSYGDWNPFLTRISGDPKVGTLISVTIHAPNSEPMNFEPVVLINDSNKEFRWKGKMGINGIFDGEHYFILQRSGPNATTLIQGENFTGILSGVLYRMIAENTKQGFRLMNESLKSRIESARQAKNSENISNKTING